MTAYELFVLILQFIATAVAVVELGIVVRDHRKKKRNNLNHRSRKKKGGRRA